VSHFSHYMLMFCAIAFNFRDRKELLLALTVSLTLVIPIGSMVYTAAQFYIACGVIEILVGLLAVKLNVQASRYITTMCVALCVFHILGWFLNGYIQNSPYRILVKIAEFAEIISCIVLSKPITGLLYKCRQN